MEKISFYTTSLVGLQQRCSDIRGVCQPGLRYLSVMSASLGGCGDMSRQGRMEVPNVLFEKQGSVGIPLVWFSEVGDIQKCSAKTVINLGIKMIPLHYTLERKVCLQVKLSCTKLWSHTSTRGPKWVFSICTVCTSRSQQTNFKASECYASHFAFVNKEDYILTGWVIKWISWLRTNENSNIS